MDLVSRVKNILLDPQNEWRVIDGEQEFHVPLGSIFKQLLRQVDFVGLEQRLADRLAFRLEEGVRHAAADEERVHLGHQVLDDGDLVADLRAAEDGDERTRRVVQRASEIFEFLLHEEAGG